jgi:hypothetical protein
MLKTAAGRRAIKVETNEPLSFPRLYIGMGEGINFTGGVYIETS